MDLNKFKSIEGFSKYMISENGEVYSLSRNRILPAYKNWAGYLTVTLVNDNNHRSPRKVHRLVYRAFVGPFEDGKIIDHKDDNKYNNHYTNLQQITPSQNSTKSFITGKNKEKVVWSKDLIHKICQMMEKNYTNRKIFETLCIDYNSNRYNCNHLIGDLRHGTIHQDITSQYDLSKYVPGVNKKDVKLTIADVESIYVKLLNGETPAALAKHFDITHSTVCKIRDKKTWRLITDSIDSIFREKGIVFNDYPLGSEMINRSTAQAYGVGENPLNGNVDENEIVSSHAKA